MFLVEPQKLVKTFFFTFFASILVYRIQTYLKLNVKKKIYKIIILTLIYITISRCFIHDSCLCGTEPLKTMETIESRLL